MRKSASKSAKVLTKACIPAKIRALLGKPPLLATEDATQYDALLAALAHDVKPSDIIECLWIKDTADLTWEIIRYRRIKTALVDGRRKALIESHLESGHATGLTTVELLDLIKNPPEETPPSEESPRLDIGWMDDPKRRAEVDARLIERGLNAESLSAESFVSGIGQLEALERMTASAELRRNSALREIERRRAAFGHALRQSSDQIIADEAPLVPEAAE